MLVDGRVLARGASATATAIATAIAIAAAALVGDSVDGLQAEERRGAMGRPTMCWSLGLR